MDKIIKVTLKLAYNLTYNPELRIYFVKYYTEHWDVGSVEVPELMTPLLEDVMVQTPHPTTTLFSVLVKLSDQNKDDTEFCFLKGKKLIYKYIQNVGNLSDIKSIGLRSLQIELEKSRYWIDYLTV